MYVEPVYLRFVGISSIRLKLFFKHQVVVLRGLTHSEPVQKMIKYLTSLICSPTESTIGLPEVSERETGQSIPRQLPTASSPASFWDYNREATSPLTWDSYMQHTGFDQEREKVLPGALSPWLSSPADSGMTEEYEMTKSIQRVVLSNASSEDDSAPSSTDLLTLYGELILPEIVYLPEHIEYHSARYSDSHRDEACKKSSLADLPQVVPAALTASSKLESGKRVLQVQLERERQRLKRLQAQHEIRVFGFSVEGLVSQLRKGQLPCIDVPLQLLPGEVAHYRTDATLCEEPAETFGHEETKQHYPIKYRIKDRGSFVLTNTRILYFGRKRHMLLSYDQLLYISHWHDFAALTVANFQKRQLFEMRRPLECMLYLEYLLRRYLTAQKRETGEIASVSSPPLSIPDTSSSIRTRALARRSEQIS